MSRGTLFVVATPIGNLEDVTLRAVRILGEVSAIACEDTRRTLKLLNRFNIKKPLISYFQPREGKKIPEIVSLLLEGRDVALVSDAGTPGISDPGYRLIAEAIRNGIRVAPVPGPNAAAAALSASGLSSHRFLFVGFPPPKTEAVRKLLLSLREEEGTVIIYLPARRLEVFLNLVTESLGDRFVVVARELTKIYEEFLRGPASDILKTPNLQSLKGEVTLLVQGKSRKKPAIQKAQKC
jgi:16S rRNA (cytidine1402-2'-O)-methyltransferase